MKRNDSGDFTIFYIEPGDQRADLFQTISMQKKPVVLMLADQAGVMQKPDDFTLLKYVKRQVDLPIIFILPQGGQQAQLAARNGFPVYQSMDALADALSIGQIARAHMAPMAHPSSMNNGSRTPRATNPLLQREISQGQGPAAPITSTNNTNGMRRSGPLRDARQQQYPPMNIPSTSPLSHNPAALNSFDVAPISPDSYSSNEHAPQIQQEARPFPPQFTPIPQAFLAEQDMQQEELYADPDRVLYPEMTNNIPYHNGNAWPGINVADRNTAPLARKATPSPVPPLPQTPYVARASRQLSSTGFATTSTNSAIAPPISIDVPNADEEELRPALRQKTLPHMKPQLPFTPPKRRPGKKRFALLLITLTCVLIAAVAGSFLLLPRFLHSPAAPPLIVGHLVFTSSGQVSEASSQGIEDQVTLDLTNVSAPTAGKALYAWLLGDKSQSDPQTILLGKLQTHNGTTHLFYPGDGQHNNLLLSMSRILVTAEDTTVTPIAPSPDQSTWQYYSEFSSTPINAPDNVKHFSFLDHLRHLLGADPTLEEFELPGGLNKWLYNNTGKVLEWVDSTRQQWEETKDTGFVRRQVERTLQFLDGDTFVYQDLPQGTSLLVNERLARVGLVNVAGPNQAPPDYLDHVTTHLNGLLEANPDSATRQKIAALITAMGNVNQWLKQVRFDAQQLLKMTDTQMQQQSTLSVLNDMITNMDNAYSGQPDASTNTMHEGVNWIHDQMQFLAIMNITTYGSSTNKVPTPNNPNLSQPRVLILEGESTKR